MNQDQIKALLLKLADPPEEFSVVLTGKKSRKVDGLYRHETRELIIHNRNHKSEHDLLHTAIHEYAHHLQYCESAVPISGRVHSGRFWAIFHQLLYKAEEMGLYRSPIDAVPELRRITSKIRALSAENGALIKQLGELLGEARALCARHDADFGDYVDRALRMPRAFAGAAETVARLDLDPRVGFENMKALARIPEAAARAAAEKGLLERDSPEMVRDRFASPARGARQEGGRDPVAELRTEKRRIERTIAHLRERLSEIESRLERLGAE
jgi:hypothetical protein